MTHLGDPVKDVQISVRLPKSLVDRLDEEATRRGRKRAAIVERLIASGLDGLPALPEEPPVSYPIRRFGEWMARLDPAIRVKVREIGESLTLLYSLRRRPDGTIDLDNEDGTVQNIWLQNCRTSTADRQKQPKREPR